MQIEMRRDELRSHAKIPIIKVMTVTWAQSVLIEAGAALQVAAIVAFVRDKLSFRILPRGGHEFPDDEEEEEERAAEAARAASHLHAASASHWKPEPRPMKDAGMLTKTDKVGFKQILKFH